MDDRLRCRLPAFPFLSLPAEIRTMIYRLLVCQDEAITCKYGDKLDLHLQILGTCSQIYLEARDLVYSDNTWAVKVFDENEYSRQEASNTHGRSAFREPVHRDRGLVVEKIQRFNILVEVEDEHEFWALRTPIRKVCDALSDIPRLTHVHITLRGEGGEEVPEYCDLLRNFTLLRRVGKVTTTGVPPAYAEYLRRRMTGDAPLDHLPKMYRALHMYAGHFEDSALSVSAAKDAMEFGDVKRFKARRAKAVEEADTYMKEVGSSLYDHDAQGEGEMQDWSDDEPPSLEPLSLESKHDSEFEE